ncbi:MAG: cation:proton antiporter, partial [Dehalococcoidia bacterium]
IALALALVGGLIARQLRLSPILGYLVTGLLIGPYTPGYRADQETLHQLAEVGVVFLMFGVGLEFQLREMLAARKLALPGALLQILVVATVTWGLGRLVGLGVAEAAVLGMAASISSTVVLIRALEERGMTTSIAGHTLIGWLIVQDLATIVMLVLLPVFVRPDGNGTQEIITTAVRGLAFTVVAIAAGSKLVPWLLRLIGRTGSRELFVLAIICLSLGIAEGAAFAGLSLALGAFIAGVAVGGTDASHQAASDVLPLRDAFAVLFFVSVGMLIDPWSIVEEPLLFGIAAAAILLLKPIVSALITGAFPVPGRVALVAGAGLGQAGEFSFILAEAGRVLGVVSDPTYHALLAASVLSIAVNPLAFRFAGALEGGARAVGPFWRWLDRQGKEPTVVPPPREHVIIAGAGRVGRLAGRALATAGLPHVYIDGSLDTVMRLQMLGNTAYWGDAASAQVLRAAGIEEARQLILAVPDGDTAALAASHAMRLRPGIGVVARAHSTGDLAALRNGQVEAAIVPEFEGAVVIVRESLGRLGIPRETRDAIAHQIRDEEYGDGHGGDDSGDDGGTDAHAAHAPVHT